MESLYWVALLVGGVFVMISLFGGGQGSDAGSSGLDHGGLDHDLDASADLGGQDAGGHAGGVADLVSLRALFLFATFFGLTGLSLHYLAGEGEPFAGIMAALVGLVVGMGGNLALRRIGQARVSSAITESDLVGQTARVAIPFEGAARGQVMLVSKGQRVTLPARALEGVDTFGPGDEVVVVRLDGRTAEVVRLDPPGALPAPRNRVR